MAWAAVAGAAVATVGGALLSNRSNNAAANANNAAADATALQSQIAADQWGRYKEIYEPLERSVVNDAQNYDTPQAYENAAGDASATVSSQFSKARDRLGRTPGLDPSTSAYQSSLTGLDLAQAATDATQQNAARQRVKDMAYARKTDALSLGKGLPVQASSTLGSMASTNLSLANANQNQANGQAGAFGRITDRIFNSPSMSNWLGNVGNTPASQTFPYANNDVTIPMQPGGGY